MSHVRRVCWLRVVLLVVLLPGLVIAPGFALDSASAQENETTGDGPFSDNGENNESEAESGGDGNESDDNATDDGISNGGIGEERDDPAPDNSSGNETDDSIGGGGGGGGFGFSQLDPRNIATAMVNHVVEWIDEHARSTFESVLEGSVEFALGTPTMDNDGWMSVFGSPTTDHYDALYDEIYIGAVSPLVLFLIVLSIMVVATVLPFGPILNSYQASSWALLILGGTIAFALSWPITSAMHLAADSIASWLGPDGAQLLDNLPELASTSGLAAAGGIYLFGWFEAMVFALLWGFRYTLLVMVMPFLFPFALSLALLGPHRVLRRLGSMFIWSYVGLLIMPWPTALLFKAAISIDWSIGQSGLSAVILTLGTLFVAILLPLVIMKATFLTNALMAGSAGAVGDGLRRRSEMGYDVKAPQQARYAGSRARDIASNGRSAAQSRAVNLGQRVGLLSGESGPRLDSRVHKGRGAGSTQAERTTMVRQASRDQGSSRRSIGQIGSHRTDVDAYRRMSD